MKKFFVVLFTAFGLVAGLAGCSDTYPFGETNPLVNPGDETIVTPNVIDVVRGSNVISIRYQNTYPAGTEIIAELNGSVVKTDVAGWVIDITGLNPGTTYTINVYAKKGSTLSEKVSRTATTLSVTTGSPNAGKIVSMLVFPGLNDQNPHGSTTRILLNNLVGTLKTLQNTDIMPTNFEAYNQGAFDGFVEGSSYIQSFLIGEDVPDNFNGLSLYSVINGEKVFVNLSGVLLYVYDSAHAAPIGIFEATPFPNSLALTRFKLKKK